MSTQPKPTTHLPLLLNPFLNAIFNNPQHGKPPFKQTIQELADNHNDYTILVPPANVLHEYLDPQSEHSSTKILLHEQCYHNEDFIRSHIIKTSTNYSSTIAPITRLNLIIYSTINGKQILVKNGMIFTGKGFKKSLKLRVLNINYFPSFCDYFPKGSQFMLVYVEDTLFGSFRPLSRFIYSLNKELPPIKSNPSHNTNTQNTSSVTFEELLRNFPLLSKAVSDKFYRLFHHNNHQFRILRTHTRKKLGSIKIEFQNMLDEAFKIVLDSVKADSVEGEQTYNLINHILSIYPGLDLNRIVHEYVELNLYDKLWSQLVFQFNYPNDDKLVHDKEAIYTLTTDKYKDLSCLSLNQLDLPIEKPWQINELYKRVCSAIGEFSKLSDAAIVNLNTKAKIIINSVNYLTKSDQRFNKEEKLNLSEYLLIDADTLIGLLIMVVVHSKVPYLEAHLYYIKNFNSINFENEGYFNYILSNIDAVIFHLSDADLTWNDLIGASQSNFEFWALIQKGDNDKLLEILKKVNDQYENSDLPNDHFLRSRNIDGESCLMLAVKTGNIEAFDLLMNFNTSWFSIDDILFDKNTTTEQTLLIVSLVEERHDIVSELVDLIIENTSYEEQYIYFNITDSYGRTAGHYLFHDYKLIDRIGHLIDWEWKDLNGHTPLFSACRCYDHSDYSSLIEKAFDCVYSKNKSSELIDFDIHKDKGGSTLLHVILRDLPKTKLLSESRNLINVNEPNIKQLTPLVFYVKYNRLENLNNLLNDDRLIFKFEDSINHYNVFDHLGFLSSKSLSTNGTFKKIEGLIQKFFFINYYKNGTSGRIAGTNAKYDPALKDWIIFFIYESIRSPKDIALVQSLSTLRKKTQIFKYENPMSSFDNEWFWLNFPQDKAVIPFFSKFKINRTIDHLNMLFINMNCCKSQSWNNFSDNLLAKKECLTFETMQSINKKNEMNRSKFGEVKLTRANITEIEVFLNFSLEDLKVFQTLISRLNKLFSVHGIKASDYRIVVDKMLSQMMASVLFPPRFFSSHRLDLQNEYRTEDSGYNTLVAYTMWLEISVTELMKNVKSVIEKIKCWKDIYENIRGLNNELLKYEKKVQKVHEAHEQNTSPSNDNASPTVTSTASRRSSGTLDMNPISPSDSEEDDDDEFSNVFSSILTFGNMIENKKSRYKKLLMLKSDEIKKIMKLNIDFKIEHESLAAEISQFVKFRSDFLTLGIKRFTKDTLVILKNRHYELCKLSKTVKSYHS